MPEGKVIVVGSIRVDVLAGVDRPPRPGEWVSGIGLTRWVGGQAANQAVAAAADGARVALLGRVGADDAGRLCRQRIARLGVDVTGVSTDETLPTSHALGWVDPEGRRGGVEVRGADAALDVASITAAVSTLMDGDVLLLGAGVAGAALVAAVRGARSQGARVVLNLVPYRPLPGDVITQADPLVVDERAALDVADSGYLPESMVVTFGAAGAAWGQERCTAPVLEPAQMIDEEGVEDAFCGALAAALVSADPVDRAEALQRASAAAAQARRHPGAQPGGPLD